MCGIAGFNASREFVASHLDEVRMFNVLEEAWLHNLHRGYDAAGYFREDAIEGKPYIRKAPLPANQIIDQQKDRVLSPSTVFGAHTRAATLGDPKFEENNHPVQYRNIIVTHNGHIANHTQWKDLATGVLPEVDSIAIPIALDDAGNFFNRTEMGEALHDLNGGMAFHAYDQTLQGISVLGRGKSSPMILRWHPELQIVVYASVDEATFGMIAAMGVDPNDPGWEKRRLDEYSYIVVENGSIVEWNHYGRSKFIGNKLPFDLARVSGDDGDAVVAHTDQGSFWAAKPDNRSFAAVRQAGKKLFGRKGFKKHVTDYQKKQLLPLAEADSIYQTDKVTAARFGNVHVLMSRNSGELLDVQDFGRHDYDRWLEIDKSPPPTKEDDSFEKFMVKRMTRVHKPVEAPAEYAYAKRVTTPAPLVGGGAKTAGSADQGSQTSLPIAEEEVNYIEMDPIVTWQMYEELIQHRVKPMLFMDNLYCVEHSIHYAEHEDPENCERVLLAALGTFASFEDIWLYYVADPSIELLQRFPKDDKGQPTDCTRGAAGEPTACDVQLYMYREVEVGVSAGVPQVLLIPVGQRCDICGMKEWVDELPEFVEDQLRSVTRVTR